MEVCSPQKSSFEQTYPTIRCNEYQKNNSTAPNLFSSQQTCLPCSQTWLNGVRSLDRHPQGLKRKALARPIDDEEFVKSDGFNLNLTVSGDESSVLGLCSKKAKFCQQNGSDERNHSAVEKMETEEHLNPFPQQVKAIPKKCSRCESGEGGHITHIIQMRASNNAGSFVGGSLTMDYW